MTALSTKKSGMIARCSLSMSKWEETSYDDFSETKKLTKASAIFDVKGDFEGRAFVEYLMVYTQVDPSDMMKNVATYVGLMKLEGLLVGKKGSFVVEDRGVFASGACKATLTIITGSGTDGFKNVSGNGHYTASHDANALELTYSFN